MLDILRRNASSVVIKIILGAIILSFALFFGFSAARKASARLGKGGQPVVATVNKLEVPASTFGYYYEEQVERMKENFKDKEMPDFIQKLAKNYALQRAISREVMLDQAIQFGIVIPDSVLASAVRQSQSQGGEFDPLFYRQRLLPHFKNRYNLDYEIFLKEDLMIQALQTMFASVDTLAPSAIDESAVNKWTFELLEVKPELKADAEAALAGSAKAFDDASKKFSADRKKVGPISIADRAQLIAVPLSLEDYEKAFSLNKENPVFPKLVEAGGKFYAIKFSDKTTDKAPEAAKKPDDRENFFQSWMTKVFAKAKVENLLPDENPQPPAQAQKPAQSAK